MAAKKRVGEREAAYLAGEDATALWASIRSATRFTRRLETAGQDTGEAYPPRLLYLMAGAVYRAVEKVLARRGWRDLLHAIEAYADGLITFDVLSHKHEIRRVYRPNMAAAAGSVAAGTDLMLDDYKVLEGVTYITDAAGYLGAVKAGDLPKDATDGHGVWNFPSFQAAKQAHEKLLCGLIRDIFDNPYRPVAFDPKWRSETAQRLAQKMYEEKDFRAMPILADALEEAGCDGDAILSHCREPGTHVRGCWVIDLVLGKE